MGTWKIDYWEHAEDVFEACAALWWPFNSNPPHVTALLGNLFQISTPVFLLHYEMECSKYISPLLTWLFEEPAYVSSLPGGLFLTSRRIQARAQRKISEFSIFITITVTVHCFSLERVVTANPRQRWEREEIHCLPSQAFIWIKLISIIQSVIANSVG